MFLRSARLVTIAALCAVFGALTAPTAQGSPPNWPPKHQEYSIDPIAADCGADDLGSGGNLSFDRPAGSDPLTPIHVHGTSMVLVPSRITLTVQNFSDGVPDSDPVTVFDDATAGPAPAGSVTCRTRTYGGDGSSVTWWRYTVTAVVTYPPLPPAPANVSSTACNGKVYVKWVPPTNPGRSIVQYVIRMRVAGGQWWSEFVKVDATTTSVIVTYPVANGTSYQFYVTSIDAAEQWSRASNTTASTPNAAIRSCGPSDQIVPEVRFTS